MKALRQRSGYRWVIVGICFFWELVFMSLTLADSVYVVPVTTALGISRTKFALVFSIRSFVQLIGSLLYGKLYERFHAKPLMILGTLFMVAGYFLYSEADSLAVFYLAAALVGVATSLMSAASLTIVLNSWFDRSAGLIFGIVFTGSSIGGAIFSAVMGRVIAAVGYANSYRLTALLAAVSALPVLIFACERAGSAAEPQKKMECRDVKKTFPVPVRLAVVLCFVIGLTVYPVEASISAHLTDRGFSPAFAAGMLGGALLCSSLGKVLLGAVYDWRGLNASILMGAVTFILGAVAFVLMRQTWMAYLFAFVFGLSIANITTIAPFLTRSLFRQEEYGSYIGLFTAVTAAGNTIGFAAMSAFYDMFGSYSGIVVVQIAVYAGAALLFCRSFSRVGMEERM